MGSSMKDYLEDRYVSLWVGSCTVACRPSATELSVDQRDTQSYNPRRVLWRLLLEQDPAAPLIQGQVQDLEQDHWLSPHLMQPEG